MLNINLFFRKNCKWYDNLKKKHSEYCFSINKRVYIKSLFPNSEKNNMANGLKQNFSHYYCYPGSCCTNKFQNTDFSSFLPN